ncbi:MAG: helix-turn-helix transcriptional regulator [Alicyclobacillaceae bacterium]|nr:helix-turn-helix transcriptional regulator [Alicyclobacillaceae bacterium]
MRRKEFLSELQRRRKERGLTQSELADGIATQSLVSLIEKGRIIPTEEMANAFAARLHCHVDELFPKLQIHHDDQGAERRAWKLFVRWELGIKDRALAKEVQSMEQSPAARVYSDYLFLRQENAVPHAKLYEVEDSMDASRLERQPQCLVSLDANIIVPASLRLWIVDAASRVYLYERLERKTAAACWRQQEVQYLTVLEGLHAQVELLGLLKETLINSLQGGETFVDGSGDGL